MKIVVVLGILIVTGVSPACYADPVTKNKEDAGLGITLRSDAPIYTGPILEEDLEELTAEDFNEFGSESGIPVDQYRQYQKVLEHPSPGILIPYKMRIIDRDLTLDDFRGFDVSEELSQARYDGYLGMNSVAIDGRTIHYVYVYHSVLVRTESGNTTI